MTIVLQVLVAFDEDIAHLPSASVSFYFVSQYLDIFHLVSSGNKSLGRFLACEKPRFSRFFY